MKKDLKNRRFFLQSTAGLSLSIPVLTSLLGRSEQALAQANPVSRFISVYSGHGHDWRDWYPSGSVSMSTLSANIRKAALSQFVGSGNFQFSNILSAADQNVAFPGRGTTVNSPGSALWNSLYSKLSIVRGLDAPHGHGDHHKGHMLSGLYDTWTYSPPYFETIDQLMIDSGKIYSTPPGVRSIHLHPGTSHFHTNTTSYRRSGQKIVAVPSYSKPSAAYDAILRNIIVGGDRSSLDAIIARKRSVIDFVKGDLDVLLADTRLSSEDRTRLEAHLQYVREMEAKLDAPPINWDTNLGTFPTRTTDFNSELPLWEISQSEADHVDRNIEIIATAIKVGATRVATMMLENGQGTHGLSHDRAESAGNTRLDALAGSLLQGREWGKRFLKLLDALDQPESGGRTFLDNTLIYWGSCMSTVRNHYTVDLPVILAGATGVIDQGSYFDFRQLDTQNYFGPGTLGTPTPDGEDSNTRYYYGRAVNELMIGIMRSFGLVPSDWEQNGEPGFGKYSDARAIYGLADGTDRLVYDFGDRQSSLPHVFLG